MKAFLHSLQLRLRLLELDAADIVLGTFADAHGERRAPFLDRLNRLMKARSAFKLDGAPAAPAGEIQYGLRASDALLDLLRASGAGDCEVGSIEEALRRGTVLSVARPADKQWGART